MLNGNFKGRAFDKDLTSQVCPGPDWHGPGSADGCSFICMKVISQHPQEIATSADAEMQLAVIMRATTWPPCNLMPSGSCLRCWMCLLASQIPLPCEQAGHGHRVLVVCVFPWLRAMCRIVGEAHYLHIEARHESSLTQSVLQPEC